MITSQSTPRGALVMGRALHAPWNEGTRVIGRDMARATSLLRPVRVVSLTQESFRGQEDGALQTEHVYTRLGYGPMGDYAALLGVIQRAHRLMRVRSFAVAHLVGLPLALAPILRLRGMRVVSHITLTNQMYLPRVERLRASLAWRVFDRWIDAYACTSQQIFDDLLRQGYPTSKLHVVPPPLDMERFQPVDRAEARQMFGMRPDAFVVVYVGTISPKRFPADQVMNALALAAEDIPQLTLEVFAPVATHSYNTAWADENVRRVAGAGHVPTQVHLQDLNEAQKAAVYSAADAVILPFSAPVAVEPPLTLLEAMACQAPVVVAPFANRSAVVHDGIDGFTFTSPAELAAKLSLIYALGADGRTQLGAEARRSIAHRFSFEAVAQKVQQVWAAIGLATR